MEFQSTREDQTSLSLTVYTNGFGLVKDKRQIRTDAKIGEIRFADVADQVDMDSIVIHGIDVLEHSYDHNFVSKGKLLEKYIGQVVTIRNHGEGHEVEVRLVSVSDGLVGERTDTKEILIDPAGELILPPLPEKISAKPSIVWKMPPAQVDNEVGVSYLTQGIEWIANYVFTIKEKTLSLSGWIKLQNQTGVNFAKANLKLIAGNVNRYETPRAIGEAELHHKAAFLVPGAEEHSFGDSHVYTLERPVTVLNDQVNHIKFMEIEELKFRKVYKLGMTSKRPSILLELENTAANQLGIPFPKGLVKVYEMDEDGELEFTGEDAIEHTPPEEKLKFHIGEAYDIVTASREKKRGQRGSFEYVMIEYDLKNHKEENIRVDIEHFIYDRLWKMESSSHDYEIINSSKVEFCARIAAGKTAKVEFTYKIDKRHGT